MRGLLEALRCSHGVSMMRDDDWETLPRTSMTIRRERVVEDALQEARKDSFDPAKMLKAWGGGLKSILVIYCAGPI